jgi:AcrR family transcriptional regulator
MSFEPLTPERRREQTREYLLRAAAQVFAERGFHGASLDEVAAVAGFTKGAVYSNFKSKDDLFLALLDSRYREELRSLRETLEASEGEPEAHFPQFVELLRGQFEAGGDAWGALTQEFYVYAMRNPVAREKLAAFERADTDSVAEIIRAERLRRGYGLDDPPEHLARIVVALVRGLFTMRLIDPEAVDRPLLETALAFIGRAMTPPPGP